MNAGISAPGTYTVRVIKDTAETAMLLGHMNETDCSTSVYDEATATWTVTFRYSATACAGVLGDLRWLAGTDHVTVTAQS
jgi:hypothetical protein